MSSKDAWAESLVGRDWEIFWDDGGDSNSEQKIETTLSTKKGGDNLTSGENFVASSADGKDEQEEGDISDWYDGRIIGYKSCGACDFSFDIRFIGEDQIYTMKLSHASVRPSARAWLIRTKALLSVSKNSNWEEFLPVDTSTLDDKQYLAELKHDLSKDLDPNIEPLRHDLSCPNLYQRSQVKQLQYEVQSQIYLRAKLAAAIGHGEDDDNEPTDIYINFLMKHLENINASCEWYTKCWNLSRKVLGTGAESALELDFIHKEYVQTGWHIILNILNSDIRPGAAKRKLGTQPVGTRRTKRRRARQNLSDPRASFCNENNPDYHSEQEGGSFLSNKDFERFEQKIKEETERWPILFLLEMLKVVTCHIQGPVVCWTQEAECVLGDKENKRNADDSSDLQLEDEDNSGDSEGDELTVEAELNMYSYDDIKSVLDRSRSHEVLAKFNLSQWSSQLITKLRQIKDFEGEAQNSILGLAHEVTEAARESDPILTRLYELKDRIKKPEFLLENVTPLAVSTASNMTKNIVEDACSIREWIIDFVHSERTRERITFIQETVARASHLPEVPRVQNSSDGPSLDVKVGQILLRVKAVSSKLHCCDQIVTQYERYLTQSVNPQSDSEKLRTVDGINKALHTLSSIPALSLVEEKLVLRKDLLLWVDDVKSVFDEPNRIFSFVALQNQYKKLEEILTGSSTSRSSLTRGLRKQEQIEKQICQFILEDIKLSNNFVQRIQTLYANAIAWNERAEAIIYSLRVHGNILAGEPLSSVKVPAMVDCRRMEDLIQEYKNLNVSIENRYTEIQSVYEHALSWSENVTKVIENENDLLTCLTECSANRPKGVIIEPARHVFELIIDLLTWHERVRCAVDRLKSLDRVAENILVAKIYSYVVEGSEIIQWYSKQRNLGDLHIDLSNIVDLISLTGQGIKPNKLISLSKVEGAEIGKRVCKRLASLPFYSKLGDPLLGMVHIVWAINIKGCLSRAKAHSTDIRLTLREAISIASKEPKNNGTSSEFFVSHPLIQDINKLTALIADFQKVEDEAKKLLAPGQHFFRDSLEKTNEIRNYQAALKDVNTRMKIPKHEEAVLLLDRSIERAIDQRVKDISWLVRTLNYPSLHDDEIEVEEEKRIPWDVLVSLFERVPSSRDEMNDDMQRLVLRIHELYEAANMWQAEVTSFLSLSIRGAKRRNTANGAEELEQEGKCKVSYMQLADLAKDPILEKIAMPREKAVRHVLDQVNAFEKHMFNLLGKDFCGISADKAPYPKTASLVGGDGKFYLYRLTGSQLFSSLKSLVEDLTAIASDIAADTPEKKTFEWIRQCVDWLQTLDDASTEQAPFGGTHRLFLRSEDASQILSQGNQLLLGVSDDIRRTLLNYRIIMSTNKQSEKLSVTIAKGGAHHSIGGTVIKWCPLVLDWIRHDIKKKEQWEKRGNELLLACKECLRKEITQAELNETYEQCENLRIHLQLGRDTLVVSPEKSMIEQLRDESNSIENWLNLQIMESAGSLSLMSARLNRYEGSRTAMQEREAFLDSLLLRRRIYSTTKKKTASIIGSGDDIRSKARFKIEKLMKKGMRMMGLRIQGASDISLLCTMKAFEIENAAFSAFCAEGMKIISKEYTEKLFRLHSSLDPSLNATLCARVLTNDISSDKLILMSPEELSNNNLGGKKARAEVAKSNSIDVSAKKSKPLEAKKKMASLSLRSLTQSPGQALRHVPPSTVQKKNATPGQMSNQDINGTSSGRSSHDASGNGACKLTPTTAAEVVQNHPKATPPPPPSLVVASLSSRSNTFNLSQGSLLRNDSGDKFNIAVSDTKVNFQVKLIIVEEVASNIDVVLPHTIKIKRRSRVDEYTSFLSSKLRSGNSILVILRLSISGKAEDAYRRFYKDYESKKRIAMCKLGEDTLFLVTPKFHAASKEIRNKISSRSSTYGVLVKRLHFVG